MRSPPARLADPESTWRPRHTVPGLAASSRSAASFAAGLFTMTASLALVTSACGPGATVAGCEPGVLDVVTVRTADDVATLARVEVMTELHVIESELVDLSGFECLRQAEKIYIERNPLLESLDGIDGLIEVVGRLDDPDDNYGAELMIRENDALADVSALGSLRAVEGTLEISGNSVLAEVVDLEALELAGRELVISENRNLEIIGGLGAFTGGLHEGDAFGVFVRINDNPMLREVTFPSTTIKAEGLEVQRNPRLADLSMHLFCSPFWYTIADSPALLRLPVSVHDPSRPSPSLLCADDRTDTYSLVGVPSVTDLTALPRVTRLAKLEIRGNSGLRDLEGLEDLESVKELIVDDNPVLQSLAGLDPAVGGRLEMVDERFAVRNNPALDQCDVDALAESLSSQTGELIIDVAGNGGGCQ